MENTSEEQGFRKIAFAGGFIAAFLGILGITGLFLNSYYLTSVYPGYVPIAFSTALIIVFIGIVLILVQTGKFPENGRPGIALILGSISIVASAESLVSIGGGHSFVGIFFVQLADSLFRSPTSHMSPVTAGLLTVTSIATILLLYRNRLSGRFPHIKDMIGTMGLGIFLLSLTFVLSYLYGYPFLYGTSTVPVALTSATAISFFGIGLIAAAGPSAAPGRYLTGKSIRARLLRYFLPLTIILIIAQNYLDRVLSLYLGISNALVISGSLVFFCLLTAYAVFQTAETLSMSFAREEMMRKQAEETLKKSEERYRNILENMQDGYFQADTEGNLTMANPAAVRMFGYPSSEAMMGFPVGSLYLFKEDRESLLTYLRENGSLTDRIVEGVRKDGTIFWVSLNAGYTYDHSGQITGTEGIARDISERRKLEEELLASEQRYRTLYDNALVGLFETSLKEAVVISCNQRYAQLAGFDSPEDARGRDILQIYVNHSDRDTITRLLREKGVLENYVIQLRNRKTGALFWTQFSARINRDRDSAEGTLIEITEQKLAEKALMASEEKFRLLYTTMAQGVIYQDREGRFTDANPAAEEILGITRDQILGRTSIDPRWHAIHKDGSQFSGETHPIMVALRTGRASRDIMGIFNPSRNSYRWIQVNAVPQFHERDTIPYEVFATFEDITDIKVVEESLRESQARLDLALRSAMMGAWFWDILENRRYFDAQTCDILGIEQEEFNGTEEEFFSRVHPEDRDLLRDSLSRTIREGIPYEPEYRVIWPDGSIHFITARAKLVKDNTGRPWKINGIIWDITKQKHAEEMIRQREVRFRSLIQNSSDIIRILDADGSILYDSPSSERILGYPAGFFIGKNPLDYIHPGDVDRVRDEISNVRAKKNTGIPTEFRIRKADGNYIYVESVATNLLDAPGIRGIVVTTRPIHERKLAEMSLRESEERFRQIFDNTYDAIYVTDVTPEGMPGQFLDANTVTCKRLGYSREELLKLKVSEIHAQAEAVKIASRIAELLTQGETSFESVHETKERNLIPVELTAHLIRIKERRAVIWVARDITQRKLEEKALRLANQKLQLMNIVAWHDIQNKVTGLRGYVELSKDLITDPQAREFVAREETVLQTIYEHIQYTKEYQEIGQKPMQWVDIQEVVRQCIEGREYAGISMYIEVGNLEIYCDPIIRKVFSHLIENSIVHGEKVTWIRINTRDSGDHMSIVYEDDGIGIPVQNKESIFMRDVAKGSGFSLVFIHDILELSGMEIREIGEPGQGSRFEITVPKGIYHFSKGK